MSEWISVKDRLPKQGKEVIWFHPAQMDSRREITLKDYYRVERFDLPNRPATHWMPLPEPPQ